MSGYTIGEILVWLVAAAVLGFLLGWLCRELAARSRRPSAPVTQPVPQPVAKPQPVTELVAEPVAPPVVESGPHPGSALPLDGGDPPAPTYVVKVSRGSKIYHAPSSPAYGRTTAALWFETAQAAEAAGFRKPKNA
jgi:hypothetical protein